MAYIKSYSNYVLKSKHQNVNGGAIYERDITTIGGLNQFAKGQIPIYKSSNFIITVNNETNSSRNFLNNKWEKNGSEEVWTLSNLIANNDVESDEKTLKIVLKQDYYRLQDFAYFGSCVELIRASIIDIVTRYPGELYVPRIEVGKDDSKNPIYEGIPVFYTSKDIKRNENGEPILDGNGKTQKDGDDGIVRLGGENWFLVDNPHNINIHTQNINESEVDDPLKYLCLSYEKYGLTSMPKVTEYACVTEYDVEADDEGKNIKRKSVISKGYRKLEENFKTDLVKYEISSLGVGSKVAEINIDGKVVGAFVGNDGNIIYLTNASIGTSILRPIDEVYNEFFDSLDNFQKILMNKDSNPKYTTLFEVISENSFGYVTELKTFTFPTTFGDYNLAVGDSAYNLYVDSLMKYAEFYDEYFTDNIWRSMTHEAIKNFDWTYTREYGIGEEEDYVFGGTRMQKTLRLIGREFDEIKTYIDALKNYQKIDYGKGNAIPDYFLTDAASLEGWDIENIYPYNNDIKQIQKLPKLGEDGKETNEELTIKPYSIDYICDNQKNGYFYLCEGEECSGKPSFKDASEYANKSEIYDRCIDGLRPKIKQYSSEKEYSIADINNHFMKILKLNSKAIFRKKGTIQGIESLLAIFGLKSKRWCDEYNKTFRQYKDEEDKKCFSGYTEDYDIKEYVAVVDSAITDEWVSDKGMNKIDWYNSTKTVSYDTEEYRNGIYYSYQGLPVRAYIGLNGNEEIIKNTGVTPTKLYQIDRLPLKNGKVIDINDLENDSENGAVRFLYPYFSPYKLIDGNPYYQMNGGWLKRKSKILNIKNEVLEETLQSKLYKETYRTIRNVNNVRDLINLPKQSLHDGDLCYVGDLSGEFALINGSICDIYTDEKGKYISTRIINNTAKVGNTLFASELTVSNRNSGVTRYIFSEYKDNTEIRIYINDSGTLIIYGKYYGINNISFFQNKEVTNIYQYSSNETATVNVDDSTETEEKDKNYFRLIHLDNKTEISGDGWNQLDNDSDIVKRLNTIVDNYKGNNPHTGHMNYDGGKEYISYFTQLFKYALDGNQFNERCYGNEFYSILENDIKNIGFSGLIDESEYDSCYYNIYQDGKIHYVGNELITTNSNNNENHKIVTFDTNIKKNSLQKVTLINAYKAYYDKFEEDIPDKIITEDILLKGNDISDQIINTKRIDINFFNEEKHEENDRLFMLKYFDNVIMNYLEQIIPSTLIVEVNYYEM